MNFKVKDCKNTNCSNKFKQFNSLQKFCSPDCQSQVQGNKKIKQVSEKRKVENEVYSKLRKQFLDKHPICPITKLPTTDIHHKKGRIGFADEWARNNKISLLLDQRFWIALSREGHIKVEENPEWAKENGYSLNRL